MAQSIQVKVTAIVAAASPIFLPPFRAGLKNRARENIAFHYTIKILGRGSIFIPSGGDAGGSTLSPCSAPGRSYLRAPAHKPKQKDLWRGMPGLLQRRKKGSFKEIIADFFELPQEIILDLPRVTQVGNVQLYIENHRGVIAYDENEIRLSVKNGEIIIRGEKMQIKNLLEEELLIKGVIGSLTYEG
jgi:sporulation protein YqfC